MKLKSIAAGLGLMVVASTTAAQTLEYPSIIIFGGASKAKAEYSNVDVDVKAYGITLGAELEAAKYASLVVSETYTPYDGGDFNPSVNKSLIDGRMYDTRIMGRFGYPFEKSGNNKIFKPYISLGVDINSNKVTTNTDAGSVKDSGHDNTFIYGAGFNVIVSKQFVVGFDINRYKVKYDGDDSKLTITQGDITIGYRY